MERESSMLLITPWERSVLELLAAGLTTIDLARRLGLAETEIEGRLKQLFYTLGAADRAGAVDAAARRGLLRN
jgi:DNA-binding NarL/FixJ family response regulator